MNSAIITNHDPIRKMKALSKAHMSTNERLTMAHKLTADMFMKTRTKWLYLEWLQIWWIN